MRPLVFNKDFRAILLSPGSWSIVGSLFEPDIDPLPASSAHKDWMRMHMHRHAKRELFITLKGKGLYGFKGEAYPCEAGSIFLFDSNEPHDDAYIADGNSMCHLWLFMLYSDVLAQVRDIENGRIVSVSSPSLTLTGAKSADFLDYTWGALARSDNLPGDIGRVRMVAALAAVFAELVGSVSEVEQSGAGPGFESAVVHTIKRQVDEVSSGWLSLDGAAGLAGYSKFHFARLFKEHVGETYHSYVNGRRLRVARAMLAERRRKKDIARLLGFSHTSSFLRWMKERGGE